jgi:hypothetical protein
VPVNCDDGGARGLRISQNADPLRVWLATCAQVKRQILVKGLTVNDKLDLNAHDPLQSIIIGKVPILIQKDYQTL